MCDCVNIEFLNWVLGQDSVVQGIFVHALGTFFPIRHSQSSLLKLRLGLMLLHNNSAPRSSLAIPADWNLETRNPWPVMSLTQDLGHTHPGLLLFRASGTSQALSEKSSFLSNHGVLPRHSFSRVKVFPLQTLIFGKVAALVSGKI